MTNRPNLTQLSKEIEEPRVLKLTLKKQWFDMILKGEKKEEYREVKDFWRNRLLTPLQPIPIQLPCDNLMTRDYDAVEFTNGYGKDKPQVTLECKGITIGQGNCKWGAPIEDVFIIKLGKEISRRNIPRS